MSGPAPETLELHSAVLRALDEHGAEALAPTHLAGVSGAPATREDLLDLVVEAVVCDGASVSADGGPWQRHLVALAAGYRRSLSLHPNAVPVMSSRPIRTRPGLEAVEGFLAALTAGGITAPEALAALNTVMTWTLGHVRTELSAPHQQPPDPAALAELPHLADAVDRTTWGLPDGEFQFGVEALLRGLDQMFSDA
ncbi:MAG: TetR/AcrR family transcriptional regulator C-terminal domain-containing protein [Thermoleophilia bacterium]